MRIAISRKVHTDLVAFGEEHWPHAVKCRTALAEPSEKRAWCEEQFGRRGNDLPSTKENSVTFNTACRWVESGDEFRFKEERDASAFKIVWG